MEAVGDYSVEADKDDCNAILSPEKRKNKRKQKGKKDQGDRKVNVVRYQACAVFAYSLLEGQVLPCLKSVRKFMAASPASILRPEASGLKRVGNLLNKLQSKKRIIDSCGKLQKLWKDNPRELFPEIKDWFQEGFHNQFEELWIEMQCEVLLDPKDRFPRKLKKAKKRT